MKAQYKLCQFYTANYDIKKQWFVYFSIYNPITEKYERKKEYVPLALNKPQRLAEMESIKKNVDKLLIAGKIKFQLPKAKPTITFKQAFKEVYTILENDISKTTLNNYLVNYNKLLAKIGDYPLFQVDTFFIEDTIYDIAKASNYENSSYNNFLSQTRRLFQLFRKKRLIDHNPVIGIARKKVVEKETKVWPKGMVDWWLCYCKENSLKFYIVSLLTYYCFIRASEIMRLTLSDVDYDNNLIYISGEKSKNRKTKSVTVPNFVLNQIKIYCEENGIKDLLIDYSTQKWQRSAFNQDLKRHLTRALIPMGYTLYKLKHSRNTELVNNGVSLVDLQQQNRHSSLTQTETYAKKLMNKANSNFLDI